MTRKLHFLVLIFIFTGFSSITLSQLLPSFAFAGGPAVGWHFNPTKDLNAELEKAGFPQMSEDGFFVTGGGGFIDLPLKSNFLRIGGFGNGFTSKLSRSVNDSLTKDANYSLGQGGIYLEFVAPLGKVIDISIGTQLSTGTLMLELYQYGKDLGNYGTLFGELQSNGSTANLARTFKSRFYTLQPQVGIGIMLRKFMYLKIDCGYQFGTQNTWRVDNDVEVSGFPDGIEAKGLMISLGLNFGLFIRDN
jgi:hypothetical protein